MNIGIGYTRKTVIMSFLFISIKRGARAKANPVMPLTSLGENSSSAEVKVTNIASPSKITANSKTTKRARVRLLESFVAKSRDVLRKKRGED